MIIYSYTTVIKCLVNTLVNISKPMCIREGAGEMEGRTVLQEHSDNALLIPDVASEAQPDLLL